MAKKTKKKAKVKVKKLVKQPKKKPVTIVKQKGSLASVLQLPAGVTKLVLIGDVHLGHAEFQEEEFKSTLKYVKDNKCAVFLMGDLIENVTPNKPGNFQIDQVIHPQAQLNKMVKLLAPIKSQILGTLRGNHEARGITQAMFDPSQALADNLKIPYYDIGGFFIIVSGKMKYKGVIMHGTTAGKDPFRELKSVAQLYEGVDFSAAGHDHQLVYVPGRARSLDTDSMMKRVVVKHYLRTGCYLSDAEYAVLAKYPPAMIGSPIMTFSSHEHHIDVDIKTLLYL